MAASIQLFDLAWSTPAGQPLLADLNLRFAARKTGLVGRNGVGKTTLLKLIAGELTPTRGRVAVAGTLGVLRQVVQVDPAKTIADLFGLTAGLRLLDCVESGEASEQELADADWTLEARLAEALNRVGLQTTPQTRLATLSGGQRTRASLAALLFADTDFLLLDEPTNNLDREGRRAVIDMLAAWRGGAIVVSHDRELLETMESIVELTSLGAKEYGGNWSTYREQKQLELAAAERDLADAEKKMAAVARDTQATRERQSRRAATGRKAGKRGGIPKIMIGGLKQNAEKTAAGNERLGEKLREQAANAAATARSRIEILQPFAVELPPTNLPASKIILKLESLSAGYDPEQPILQNLSFEVIGPERVAIAGPNGCGKTTLLNVITKKLEPSAGLIRVATDFALLDQQVSLLDPQQSIRDNFRRLNPVADENACRASLARFMFRADAALQIAGTLSGGQLLRAGLACVLGRETPPPLLLLDEPTNHLDIDSIEVVEAGLRAYDGALVVVSHDESFLQAIGITRRLTLPMVASS
ncbi:ABC-F family ATP-binding cassette domain-containing protein [Anatilimnocola floriformis]|uniref:ABC-F family ATP-binding cassette domain-containing protein n=1 Tax=Anatilimnocola floriformis TaxID=2948575 RepID=UPI0020C2576B|nr:ABC-F family ATP-binding cassette domain-containing protein [Anatilimnocola floriformis]